MTAAATTLLGVMTAFALVRFEFRGKQMVNTLVILPALVPETILGVGLLVLIKAIDQPRSLLLLRARPYPSGASLRGAGRAGAHDRHQARL